VQAVADSPEKWGPARHWRRWRAGAIWNDEAEASKLARGEAK